MDAYARLLAHSDAGIRGQAARDWCDWEAAVVSLESGGVPDPRFADARLRTPACAMLGFMTRGIRPRPCSCCSRCRIGQ